MNTIPNTHVVIYHKNCLDGFGAALAAKIGLEEKGVENIEFYALDYPEREKFLSTIDLLDKNVHILDFSFNSVQFDFICDVAETVVWLDHHESAFKEHGFDFSRPFVSKNYGDGVYVVLSNNQESGAALAWLYYKEEIPELIQHIDDRDRWQWKLAGTKEICTALSRYPQDFNLWLDFLHNTEELFNEGKLLNEYYQEQLTRAIDSTKESCTINGINGLCCNLPPMFASEAGSLLAAESGTFGATWFKDASGNIKWSLRSIGDFNVADIAVKFGGGGHKNAAGFTIDGDYGISISPRES